VIEPLRFTYEISCPVDHAFDVWTKQIATWWPKGHSTSGDPDTVVHLEPRVGGRIFERTSDGREIDWGEVTRWDPPAQLGYTWHIGRTSEEATEVELTFVELGDDRTRLDIVHSGWDRLGAEGSVWREANTNGWNSLVPAFTAVAER
jgi:hypothetical protein